MNTKSISLTITFAAAAIALNAVKIPSIFYPGVPFQISQIPIVVAFLLFGTRVGVLVGVINLAGALALFPLGPNGVIIYAMDFLSVLIMFAGLYLGSKFMKRNGESERLSFWKKPLVGFTGFATVVRGSVMPFFDYAAFHVLVPLFLGLNLPEAYIVGLVPAFVLYNVVVTLYAVPVAYFVAKQASKHLRLEPHFFRAR
jgi:riboflavin transporter FmnP